MVNRTRVERAKKYIQKRQRTHQTRPLLYQPLSLCLFTSSLFFLLISSLLCTYGIPHFGSLLHFYNPWVSLQQTALLRRTKRRARSRTPSYHDLVHCSVYTLNPCCVGDVSNSKILVICCKTLRPPPSQHSGGQIITRIPSPPPAYTYSCI